MVLLRLLDRMCGGKCPPDNINEVLESDENQSTKPLCPIKTSEEAEHAFISTPDGQRRRDQAQEV